MVNDCGVVLSASMIFRCQIGDKSSLKPNMTQFSDAIVTFCILARESWCIAELKRGYSSCWDRHAKQAKRNTFAHREYLIMVQWSPPKWHMSTTSWWRHQMETFSALLAICVGNSPVPGEVPAQRPVRRNFDVFFDLRQSKRVSKQWWGWWFETPSCPLWRHCNDVPLHLNYDHDGLRTWKCFSDCCAI